MTSNQLDVLMQSQTHKPSISHIRSVPSHNEHRHSESLETRVVKLYRSKKHRDHYNLRKENQSTSIRHSKSQTTSNNNHLPSNEPINSRETLPSCAPTPQQIESNKTSATSTKNIIHPANVITIRPYRTSSSFSSQNSTKRKEETNSSKASTANKVRRTESSIVPDRYEEEDGWLDLTSFDTEHRQKVNKKNKNKCSQPHIIACVIVTFVLTTVTAVILGIVLSKKKATISTTPILRWNSMGTTVAGITGQCGNASNLLCAPFGLTLDSSNALYVADWANNRIQKLSMDTSFGFTVAGQANGTGNTTSSYLYYPSEAAVDSNGNIYVADAFNNRIQFWASGSSSGVTVAGTGVSGSANTELNMAYGIARDPNSGTLYIADTGNHRVISYLSGASSGTVIAGGTGAGLSNTQLSNPIGLYFEASTNSLLIANYGANNIVRWIIGANNWTLVAGNMNGLIGNTSTELNQPMDVTSDPMGNIYVVDMGNNRIQFFSQDQSNGITIAGITSSSGNDSILLNNPYSITLDNQLNLYVADTFNHRVQKFSRSLY